jgi:hypothetical protein
VRARTAAVLVALLAGACAAAPPAAAESARTPRLPRVMLWAWEWPQDLSSLDPSRAGVAYLAGTLRLAGDEVLGRPRRQPLRLPPGVTRVAVVRIEAPASARASLSDAQAGRVARAVLGAVRPGLAGLQVDFDAARSQRGFYRRVLALVRAGLPDTLGLTMTALASWGIGDRWLEGLPVDAAVPMAFRMGADGLRVREAMARGEAFTSPPCRDDLGVMLDEPLPDAGSPRRVWVFQPGPWTGPAIRAALARYGG